MQAEMHELRLLPELFGLLLISATPPCAPFEKWEIVSFLEHRVHRDLRIQNLRYWAPRLRILRQLLKSRLIGAGDFRPDVQVNSRNRPAGL